MKSELYDRELIKNNLKKREAKDKMVIFDGLAYNSK